MMNMKKMLLSGLLFLGVLSAQAQAQQEGKTEYVFTPHWYVQVQPLGGQYTLGEVDFSDLFSYNVQAGLGYNFNPVLGARFSVNAWQSKAGIDNSEFRVNAKEEFVGKWSWKYVAPSIELTCNLSNALFGYKPERLFNLGAFIGVGANIGFSNDDAKTVLTAFDAKTNLSGNAEVYNQNMDYLWDGTKVRVTGRAGLTGDFRINDQFSVGLEVNANVLSDRYNSKRASNADWYFNALAGVKYNLGKTYEKKFIPAPEPKVIEKERIVYRDPEPAPVTQAVAAATIEPIRRDIFFKINSFRIDKTEAQKVKDIADYMAKYPEAKVIVTGYADAGTGNDRINDRLAAQRADAVVKALKTQYKISADRISYDSKGARVQPFEENDKNRVSICIAE